MQLGDYKIVPIEEADPTGKVATRWLVFGPGGNFLGRFASEEEAETCVESCQDAAISSSQPDH